MNLVSMKLAAGLLATLLLAHPETMVAAEMRGLLVFGHEARTLQPCGDTRTFWVSAPEVRQQLATAYRRLATRPYAPVYAELEGEFVDQPTTGFAADYDGTVEVHAIRSVSRENIEACRAQAVSVTPEPVVGSEAKTYVFVCEDQSTYTVRATETEAWLFHPEGTRKLWSVPAEAGAKYSDGSFGLWIDDQEAKLGALGSQLMSCRNDRRRAIWERAKLDGADFRALGNEPGWSLEIREGRRIVLVADYGASRVELPLPEPIEDREARTTRWDAGELTLEVIGRPCRDSMSGEPFEAEVVVTWQGKTLRGCGRALH